MTERNGSIAMTYTTSTISGNPYIARISMKFGESSATIKAGTYVTIAKIVSENPMEHHSLLLPT